MKNTFGKIFSPIVIIALIVGLFLFGLLKYIEYRFDIISAEIEEGNNRESFAEAKYKNLESMILGTKSNVADVLAKAEEKNNALKDQFVEITHTVGALERLSSIDPELLKKYSKVYFLNEHYVPVSLTPIEEQYVNPKSKNFQFLSDAWPHLEELFDAASADGLSLQALSAYRSFSTQSVLKATYKFTYGAGTANQFSAEQGYSEHQLGTALDFTTAKTGGALEGFEKTPEYKWLLDNAYKYGFIISYPQGNTYYKFEPWHWRFVGVALAERLHDDHVYFYGLDQRIIDTYLANIFD